MSLSVLFLMSLQSTPHAAQPPPPQSTPVSPSFFTPSPLQTTGALQHAAASVPTTPLPLLTVLDAWPEQSTSPVPPGLPEHFPATIQQSETWHPFGSEHR